MPQYSPEWWETRRGVPTASSFDRILTGGGKPSAQQDDYVAELIGDIHTLLPNFFSERPAANRAMQHGTDTEPEARRWFEMESELEVRQVGFCLSDDGRFGCSPDGLVYTGGELLAALELKCPQPKTQVRYVLDDELPNAYRPQVHGQLLVTGLPCVHFVSYCPGLPPLVKRIEPDDYTARLAEELERFWGKLSAAKEAFLTRGVIGRPAKEIVAKAEEINGQP